MGTPFTKVYNRFLGKITDDMYIELTPEDTIKDLQNLIIDAIPGFEFPRKNLMDYEIKTAVKREDELLPDDFVIGVVWGTIPEDDAQIPNVIIEQSSFAAELTDEEIQFFIDGVVDGSIPADSNCSSDNTDNAELKSSLSLIDIITSLVLA